MRVGVRRALVSLDGALASSRPPGCLQSVIYYVPPGLVLFCLTGDGLVAASDLSLRFAATTVWSPGSQARECWVTWSGCRSLRCLSRPKLFVLATGHSRAPCDRRQFLRAETIGFHTWGGSFCPPGLCLCSRLNCWASSSPSVFGCREGCSGLLPPRFSMVGLHL
ncbi:unnamed protein product [Amoebophrya sp. A120]|nr:unnamed protein product [Amoebophrya sp. A120]|eukprot:GSA120T00008223001.1